MAPKKASPQKSSPRKPSTANASPPKKRGRPSKKQADAEERAEQEIAAETETRTTRSKASPAKETAPTKAVAPSKVTKTPSAKKKPVAKSKVTKPSVVSSEDEESDAIETTEAASPPKKATGKPRKPPTKKTTPKILLKAIHDNAYRAVLDGGIDALASASRANYKTVKPEEFDKQSNAGAVKALREIEKNRRREESLRKNGTNIGQSKIQTTDKAAGSSKPPTPTTGTRPRITAKTPEPTHADAVKQANEERKRLLEERNTILANHDAYSATLHDENQVKGVPELSQRGNMISSTNPGIISIVIDKNKPNELQERVNPFFETLPGPEVWHRNMPPFFSFGETKFMQQQISDEINHDLARPHPGTTAQTKPPESPKKTGGLLDSVILSPVKAAYNRVTGSTPQPEQPAAVPVHDGLAKTKVLRPDQWTLPKLTPSEKAQIVRDIQEKYPGYKPQPTTPPASPAKRKQSVPVAQSPRKRSRAPGHTHPQ